MDDYTMSIASDPSKRKRLMPGARSRRFDCIEFTLDIMTIRLFFCSKLRFLYLEIFGDFASHNFGSFEFYTTLMVFLFALWLRIYIHYLAQYLFIQVMESGKMNLFKIIIIFLLFQSLGTPVYSFHLGAIQILFKYSSASISTAAEVGIVAIGTIANLCIFICCTSSGYMFYKVHRSTIKNYKNINILNVVASILHYVQFIY